MSVTVTIEGLERLQAGVVAAPATLEREVRAGMVASSKIVEATQREMAPKFSGTLIGSIASTITATSATIGPRAPYAQYVERGRGPGKPPPVSAVEPWARAHGIDPFLLARAIGRRGTKPHPFVQPSLERNVSRIVAEFQNVGLRVVARMAA